MAPGDSPTTRDETPVTNTTRRTLVVGPEHQDERLDRWLAQIATASRRRLRAWISEGAFLRNGQPVRVQSRQLQLGDVITVTGEAAGTVADTSLPPLPIVHRDSWLLAVDKPAGLLSQPARTRQLGELAANELALMHLALADGRPPFLRLVHRLDRGTSGLLLFALHPDALPALDRAWRDGQAERDYLALSRGTPDFQQRSVEAPIARSPGRVWRFEVSARGRPAQTHVEALGREGEVSLLRCRLSTGRTHQVRVHLAHIGLPVLGDVLYGGVRGPAHRPMLHAAALRLPHPRTGRRLELHRAPPEDFRSLLPAALPDMMRG